MHIGLVGGLDREANRYERLAKEHGHSLECHTGDVAGRGGETLETLVLRADVVVVVTDVNSHAGMWSARRLARRHDRRCLLIRRMGISRFRTLLTELDGAAPSERAFSELQLAHS
jgi:hypothetical protein